MKQFTTLDNQLPINTEPVNSKIKEIMELNENSIKIALNPNYNIEKIITNAANEEKKEKHETGLKINQILEKINNNLKSTSGLNL